jgi:hypothetical protein
MFCPVHAPGHAAARAGVEQVVIDLRGVEPLAPDYFANGCGFADGGDAHMADQPFFAQPLKPVRDTVFAKNLLDRHDPATGFSPDPVVQLQQVDG